MKKPYSTNSLVAQGIVGSLIRILFLVLFLSGCSDDMPEDWCVENNENWIPWAEGTIRNKELVPHPIKYRKEYKRILELEFDNNKKAQIGYIRDFDSIEVGQTGVLYKYNKNRDYSAWFQWIPDGCEKNYEEVGIN